jgi:hypothetical protein
MKAKSGSRVVSAIRYEEPRIDDAARFGGKRYLFANIALALRLFECSNVQWRAVID